MSDEEEQLVSSDGSASDEEEPGVAATISVPSAASERPKRAQPLMDHASLMHHLETQPPLAQTLRMSKYEYARVKGARLEQLQRGAVPCVAYSDAEKETVETIFRREFLTGRVPLMVIRQMPDGTSQYIKVKDFVDRDSTAYD